MKVHDMSLVLMALDYYNFFSHYQLPVDYETNNFVLEDTFSGRV